MDLLISANTVPQAAADTAPASGTPGWATDGNPATGVLATDAPAWHYNMMMSELLAIVKAAGITPSNSDWSQTIKALKTIFTPAQYGVAPYSADLATLIGGYPLGAVVQGSTPGAYWVSTAAANTTVPGATGASWKSLFDGYGTQEWAQNLFATIVQLNAEATARASADSALQSNITAEATTRATADTAIQASVTQETNARVAADALSAKLSGGNTFTGDQATTGNMRVWNSTYAGETLISTGNGLSWFQHYVTRGGTVDAYLALQASSVTTHLGTVALTSQLPFTDPTVKLQYMTHTNTATVENVAFGTAFSEAVFLLVLADVGQTTSLLMKYGGGALNKSGFTLVAEQTNHNFWIVAGGRY
ncbi:MAG: hypothetical protein ABF888_03165 [Acetobacter papayae]